MHRRLIFISAAMLGIACVANAGTPGFNLGWNRCSTASTAIDKSYTCDSSDLTVFSLQGTFRPAHSVPDFAGCSASIAVQFASAIPDYWRVAYGQCDYPMMTLANPASTAPCVTTNIFDPAYSGGGFAIFDLTSSKIRIGIDWATGSPTPPSITAGQLYPAFNLTLEAEQGVANGCAGCGVPACLVMESVAVFGFGPNEQEYINTPDVLLYATWQGGAIGGSGCPAATPAQGKTWGSVKALYR